MKNGKIAWKTCQNRWNRRISISIEIEKRQVEEKRSESLAENAVKN